MKFSNGDLHQNATTEFNFGPYLPNITSTLRETHIKIC